MACTVKKKVLFLIDSLGGGGAEKVLITLLEHLDKSQFDVTLSTIVDAGVHRRSIPEWIKYKPILRMPESRLDTLGYSIKYRLIHKLLPLRWVYRFFLPQSSDVEVAFVEGFTTKLLANSTNTKAKKIAWVHIDLLNNHWTSAIYDSLEDERAAYAQYDTVAGVSNQITEVMESHYLVRNAITVHNPIDTNDILAKSKEKVELPPCKHRFRLVTIGRLEPQKGYDRLIRIMHRLVSEDKFDVELWVLGDGTMRRSLEDLVEEYKLGDNVLLLGFKSNPYPYLAQGDLFVCSSRSEGYSTAVTEAIILQLPVVATACSGMVELLGSDGEYGIITENSEDALYAALKNVLADEKKLSEYRRRVKQKSDEFSISRLMEPIESVLKS